MTGQDRTGQDRKSDHMNHTHTHAHEPHAHAPCTVLATPQSASQSLNVRAACTSHAHVVTHTMRAITQLVWRSNHEDATPRSSVKGVLNMPVPAPSFSRTHGGGRTVDQLCWKIDLVCYVHVEPYPLKPGKGCELSAGL